MQITVITSTQKRREFGLMDERWSGISALCLVVRYNTNKPDNEKLTYGNISSMFLSCGTS